MKVIFSNNLNLLLEKLHFLKVVIAQFFIILFKRKKGIELLYLTYKTENVFDFKTNKTSEYSYIIVNYKFRNAIYYRFGKDIPTEKNTTIFDIEKLDEEFKLTVYGFFRKKKYQLKLQSKFTINSNNFKTQFNNLNLKLEQQTLPKLAHPTIYIKIDKPLLNSPQIKLKKKPIKILTNKFNQNDFI